MENGNLLKVFRFFYGSAVSRNVVQGEKLLPRFALPFLIFLVNYMNSELNQ